MILVHFHQKMEIPTTGLEDLVGWTVWVGFETKSWSVFAFLFGVGFAILIRNAEARGVAVVPLYLRRMAFLAGIGILVQVLTGFQILLEYAMWGVVLLFVRKLPTPVLIVLGLAASVATRIYGHPIRFILFGDINYITPVDFTLFILGLLAVRYGIFEDVARNKRIIIGAMIYGFISWAIAWLRYNDGPAEYGVISDRWLSLTYAGAVILLLHYRPIWKKRLSIFGTAGRMALTNYVLQAAVIATIATGMGISIRAYAEIPATVILFGSIAAFSAWWLSRFRYGPLEWMWRVVTYWKWQRLTASPSAA